MSADGSRSVFPGFADLDEASATVGQMLGDHRRRLGLSQAELAVRMGTSQPAVARLEAGATNARLSTLVRYAEALDLQLSVEVHPPELRR